jgi:hypothetical protein
MDSPPSRAKEGDIEKGRAGAKVKPVVVDNSPSTKRDRRTATIQPGMNTKQAPAAVGSTRTATAGQRSGFDAETPVAKSFREKYMRR